MPSPFIDTLGPERQLLLCCARTKMPSDMQAKARALSSRRLEWNRLFSEATEHSLAPLVDRWLGVSTQSFLPPSQIERWKQSIRAKAVSCLSLTAGLLGVLREFNLQGIRAIPYKGPVLAVQAYGDAALRSFDDVDIILRQRDMRRAHEAMRSLGYVQTFPLGLEPGGRGMLIPGEYKYYSEARDVIVELHTERTLRHFPIAPDLDKYFERTGSIALSGHQVCTFSPEDALVVLSIHGAKDFWGRLLWIADIAELVQSQPQLNWERVAACAESLRARRMLHLALILAVKLLGLSLPPEITAAVEKDETAAIVANDAQQSLWKDPYSGSALARFRFRARMLEDRMAGWHYAARLGMAPTEEDWRMVQLPVSLSPLYFVLRPLRLLQKYGQVPRASERSAF
jgi:Uncharacterised nucleotidyltransferase